MRKSYFALKDQVPADTINRARNILSFIQLWAEIEPERSMNLDEISGLYEILEAVNFLMGSAQEEMEKLLNENDGKNITLQFLREDLAEKVLP